MGSAWRGAWDLGPWTSNVDREGAYLSSRAVYNRPGRRQLRSADGFDEDGAHAERLDEVVLAVQQDCPFVGAHVDVARVCEYDMRMKRYGRECIRTSWKDKVGDDERRLSSIERAIHFVDGFLDLGPRRRLVSE